MQKNNLKKTILYIAAILLFPFVIWNITYMFWVAIPLTVIYLLGLWKQKLRAIFIGLGLYLLMLPLTLNQMVETNTAYFDRVKNKEHLNAIEKWNIYGLNITAGLVGLPIYPEVAIETLLMIFPDEDKVRTFHSDFFLESDMLRTAMQKNKKGKLAWAGKYYVDPVEARTSLALNQCFYEVTDTQYIAAVKVRYPASSFTTVVDTPYLKIRTEEGLFHYLETVGWLFPYKAVWIADR